MKAYTARTHAGLHRETNEDRYAADRQLGLWVVADGLGGHQSGEVASSIACEVILNDVRAGESLLNAIGHAHRQVLEAIDSRGSGNNMGSTVVALRLVGDAYEIAWVGDSRAYAFDGELRLLTSDHSAVNELVKSGAIDSEKARSHPQRHALIRSLGVSSSNACEASTVSGVLKEDEQILLCTDGLTEELSDAVILDLMCRNGNRDSQADALLNAALAGGGRDNITLLIVGEPGRRKAPDPRASNLEATQEIHVLQGEAQAAVSKQHRAPAWMLAGIIASAFIGWLLIS